MRRTRLLAAATVAMTSAFLAGTAQAYSPGTATAGAMVYNVNRGGYEFRCSFSGWRSGANVSWSCKLYLYTGCILGWPNCTGLSLVQNHTGAWTPSPTSLTTPTYFRGLGGPIPAYCVDAFALSVDGGASSRRCNF